MDNQKQRKTCAKCGYSKPYSEFYKNKARYDGVAVYCKTCHKQVLKHYESTEIGRLARNARVSKYLKTSKGKETAHRRDVKDRSKVNCRNRTRYAIKIGRLVKRPCKCGATENIHAHHHDYSKHLDITWLCEKCHINEHRKCG